MIVRHICSWQHQSTSRRWWALKTFFMELVNHLGRNCSCLDCLMLCCMNWTCRVHKKWLLKLPIEGISGFLLQESVYKTFCRTHKKSDWQTANMGRTIFDISWFMEAPPGYIGLWTEDWMLQWYRRTLGDCPGKIFLSILESWKLLTMHFLLT